MMKRIFFAAMLAAVAMPATVNAQKHTRPPVSGAMDCERACLETTMNAYLKAMVTKDRKGIQFDRDFRHTENGVELPLDKGFWLLGNEVGTYRLMNADAARGEIIVYATMKENGIPGLISVRLKVHNKAIRESEIIVQRDNERTAALDTRGVEPIWHQEVPVAQRLSREALVQAADRYFDGIEQGSAVGIAFAPDCLRVESGVQTTSNPTHRSKSLTSEFQPFPLNCTDNINSRFFDYVSRITPRRYHVVDEERGVVSVFVVFVHDGDMLSVQTSGGLVEYPNSMRRPSMFAMFEAFKADKSGIRRIEAIGSSYWYGSDTGWD